MGGPASTTAEIYMQAHEHNTATPAKISTALHPPKPWERFADVYSILRCAHLENFFHQIKKFHQNISLLCRKKVMKNVGYFQALLATTVSMLAIEFTI